jgi:hypothetical protein
MMVLLQGNYHLRQKSQLTGFRLGVNLSTKTDVSSIAAAGIVEFGIIGKYLLLQGNTTTTTTAAPTTTTTAAP